MASPPPPDDIDKDLGLGARVAQQSGPRLLNRDGSFNVVRAGLPLSRSLSAYHVFLSTSWTGFFLAIAGAYLVTNLAFACGYLLCGPDALHGASGTTLGARFREAFFFSVQTLATIGYGRVSPDGLAANLVVTVEALVGLLGFALATGLLFSRFSRPTARIVFSERAVVAPYRGITGFMFRIANERSHQLIEVEATVTLSRWETQGETRVRKFYELPLERRRVVFFPLHWVIVHPIDEKSPLRGVTPEAFDASDPEVFILLTAVDETFSQTVHARSSYKHYEVVWDARFRDIFLRTDDGRPGIDLRLLHDTEKV
jgi:inward rectifier potassium channel